MCNLNAICSTWHLWPRAYRGLCWVSLTLRPCQGKMWSMLLQQELSSTEAGLYQSHCCPSDKTFWPKKVLILLFLRTPVGELSLFLPFLLDAQKRTQRSLWEGGSLAIWTKAWPWKKELTARDTALLLLEGNMGFEERIKEPLILALYLGELISQKYFLWAQCLCHVLCEGHGKAKQGEQQIPAGARREGRRQWGCREGSTQCTGREAWAPLLPGVMGSAPPYLPQAPRLGWILWERSWGLPEVITAILHGEFQHLRPSEWGGILKCGITWLEMTLKTRPSHPTPCHRQLTLHFGLHLYLQRVLVGNHKLIHPKHEPDLNQSDLNHWF